MNDLSTKNAKILHEKRLNMYKKNSIYQKSYLNSKTGLVKEKFVENRNCPVCRKKNAKKLFLKNGFFYNQCKTCKMVYVNPVMKDKYLDLYYKNNHTAQALAHNQETEFYRRIYTNGLREITKFKKSGSLLDLGCSSGLFLTLAKKWGFQTYGIEINTKEANIAKKSGHSILGPTIQSLDKHFKFDVICLWDVFEHIKNGLMMLKTIKQHIKHRGLVFLQIPNANGLAPRILHEHCNMFDGFEHVNLYSPKTITTQVSAAKLKVVSMCSVIDEIKPIVNYCGYENPYFGSFSSNDLKNIFESKNLLKNQLGYKLQVILRSVD